MSRSVPALAPLLALAAACTWGGPRTPEITGVSPRDAPNHLGAVLRVEGTFDPGIVGDFDRPDRSTVTAGYTVALVAPGGASRVALADVVFDAPGRLRGTLAQGAPPGVYDVTVRDPRGRVAVLAGAFTVFVPDCVIELGPCDDGNRCTVGDRCERWRCVPGAPVLCAAIDACHQAGVCDPGSGLCSNPAAPDGTPCLLACAAGDRCDAGVCTPVPGSCLNTPPAARVTVSPGGGTAGTTRFTLDASASTDAEDPPSALQFRFDPASSGSWSSWSTSPTLLQAYPAAGTYSAAVEVRDTGGLTSYATALVVVAAPGDEVKVTTSVDELDPGATPAAPGGTGLSLREAVAWVNAQPTPKTITLAAPLAIAMTGSQRSLTLTSAGAAVVAERGVVLDFGSFNKACFTLSGPNQRLVGLTLSGCTKTYVEMAVGSEGSQVAQLTIAATDLLAIGVDALATAAAVSRIGPGNDLSGLSTAVNVIGGNYEIARNRIHGSVVGAKLYGLPADVFQNVFYGQVGSPPNSGVGLRAYAGTGPVKIRHNVFDRNAVYGVQADAIASLTIRNNLFTRSGSYGLGAVASGLTLDHNGYFANVSGAVLSTLATGPTDLLADPLFFDGPVGDFRLLPQSPAIDAGIDTGLDVNGPASGLFSGLAPDLGAFEIR